MIKSTQRLRANRRQSWLGLSEQLGTFCQVDFRLDYAATIIGVRALK